MRRNVLTQEDLEGVDHGLLQVTIMTFTWRDCGKQRPISVRTAGELIEIRTRCLPNINLKRYRCVNMRDKIYWDYSLPVREKISRLRLKCDLSHLLPVNVTVENCDVITSVAIF